MGTDLNIQHLREIFAGQDLVFWLAAMAVALGLSLLMAVFTLQLRKVWGKKGISFRRPTLRWRRKRSPEPGIRVTETGYEASARGSAVLASPPVGPAARAEDILERLRRASAILEDILERSGPRERLAGQSDLKRGSGEVDYLYRRGMG